MNKISICLFLLVLLCLCSVIIHGIESSEKTPKNNNKNNKKSTTTKKQGKKNEQSTSTTTTTTENKNKKQKQDKNWQKINYMDVEKGWEEGDAEEELENDFDHNRKILEKKRPKIDLNDGNAIRSAYNQDPFLFGGGGGGMMVFVDLHPTQPDGSPWTKKDVDFISKKFASMLRSDGITATVFNIEEHRLLLNLDKSWNTKNTLKFLSKQREVDSITANSKTYKPKEFLQSIGEADDDDDEDDEL